MGLEHLRKLQGKMFALWFKIVFASGFFEQFNIYFLSHEIHNLAGQRKIPQHVYRNLQGLFSSLKLKRMFHESVKMADMRMLVKPSSRMSTINIRPDGIPCLNKGVH